MAVLDARAGLRPVQLTDAASAWLKSSAALLVVVAAGLFFSWSQWSGPVHWTPDSLFYQAQSLEIGGTPAPAARRAVFHGPLERLVDDGSGRFTDARWIALSSGFYRRRWVVPAAAAAGRPLFGDRSLELVSLLGYLLSGALAFVLLRRRFGVAPALATALAMLWLPRFRAWSFLPLTDSMGVATLFACILAGWNALARRTRASIALWGAAVALLAFTRDAAVIAVVAALFYFAFDRSRRSALVAAVGALAAAPAPLLFGAPLRTTMAFTFSGDTIPAHDSWGFVLGSYWSYARWMIDGDYPVVANATAVLPVVVALVLLFHPVTSSERLLRYRRWTIAALLLAVGAWALFPAEQQSLTPPLAPGVVLLLCLLPLFAPAPRSDVLIRLARGGAVGAVAYLFLLPQWTDLRLGLVLLPFAAIGLARAIAAWREQRPLSRPAAAA